MPTIRKVSADAFEQRPGSDAMTEAQRKRAQLDAKLRKALTGLDERSGLVVTPSDGEKLSTLRNRLVKVSQELDIRLAIRKHGDGWLVGLWSEKTRPTRGRKAALAPLGAAPRRVGGDWRRPAVASRSQRPDAG